MNLCDVYRAGDVIRWQIVKTIKPQSVAEHSFQVAMIAMTIWDKLFLSKEGQLFKYNIGKDSDLLLRWCLFHDLPEVFTGDVATPFKVAIKKAGVDPFSLVEGMMSEQYLHLRQDVECNPVVKHVVKLADMIESVKYLDLNLCTPHGKKVQDIIKQRIEDYDYPNVTDGQPFHYWQWELAVDNTVLQLFGEESTLDDMLGDNDGTETRTKSLEEAERDLNSNTLLNV